MKLINLFILFHNNQSIHNFMFIIPLYEYFGWNISATNQETNKGKKH